MNRPPLTDDAGARAGRYGQPIGSRWRLRERPFPTAASPTCAVFEFKDPAKGWVGLYAFRPDGVIVRSDGQHATWSP